MKLAFKKTVSLVLSVALSFGLLPSTVLAVEGEAVIQDSGITKPVLTIAVSGITDGAAALEVTSNQDGTVYYPIQEASKEEPDVAFLKTADSAEVTTAAPFAIDAKGLLSDTAPMLREMTAGTPDTSWYTTNPSASSYTISTADQLAGLALLLANTTPSVSDGFVGKTFTLNNDINLSAYQSGSGWTPIGTYYSFSGTFDGNGKTITGLKTSDGSYPSGLFGTVYGGTVKNLKLDDVDINAPDGLTAGGIAGEIGNGGIIENCSVSGTISTLISKQAIGGIAGRNLSSSTIRNCISTATVSGVQSVGGIAGNSGGTIENCYATGTVTADTSKPACYAGGIVAMARADSITTGCAAMNDSITGVSTGIGRIFGNKHTSANSSNNYAAANMLVNGVTIAGGSEDDVNGAPKTTADWFAAATWGSSGLNWDTAVWEIAEGSLPSLKIFGAAPPASIINISQHPEPITSVIVGEISGSLSVTASVTPDGPLSYQWYENTTESSTGGTVIPGKTSSSFAIPTTLTAGTYYYFCEVSAGGSSARSTVAKVNVTAVADTEAPIPGAAGVLLVESVFTPSSRIALSWTKATDNASAPSALKYYIYRSSSDNISTAENCQNNGTLQNYGGLPDIGSYSVAWPGADAIYYFNVVVEDESGNRVAYKPVIRNSITFAARPTEVTVTQGYISGSLSVEATVSPEEAIDYQWYFKNVDNYGSPDTLSGQTGSSLTIPTDLTAGGNYYYFCKASIKGGSIWAYSDRIKVTVSDSPVAPTITGPTSMALTEGYAAASTGIYTITGTEAITVTKDSGNEKITWNNTTKKLDIAAGLAQGSYPVTLKAENSFGQIGTLTFTLTVNPDPDIAIVNTAKSAAESTAYSSMTQAAATSETAILDALKATAVAAVSNTDVTITINKVSYTVPTAGNADFPLGTNGSFAFTITVAKGSQSQTTTQKTIAVTATPFTGLTNVEAVAEAKKVIVDGSVHVAFGATQVNKTAAVQNYVNSLLTGDAAGVTAVVSYNDGTGEYDVALSKGSATGSKSLAMTVIEAPDPDISIVNTAKSAAEGAAYSNMAQAAATSETAISDALKATAAAAVDNTDVTVAINKVSYTEPTAGNADTPSGTNGSFAFTITVGKGSQSQTTAQKTIAITATPFTGLTNAEAVAEAKKVIVDGSVHVAFGATQVNKTAAVQNYVNSLLTGDAAGVTAVVSYNDGTGEYDVALSKGSATGSKSLAMTVIEAAPVTVSSVSIKTAPSKITYAVGEALNLSGLVITLNKSDGSEEDVALTDFVSKGISVSPSNGTLLTTSHTKITIAHAASGKSADQAITVNSGSNGSDSGGSSSGGSTTTPATTAPENKPDQPVTASAPITATAGTGGTASAAITDKAITDAIAKAQADAEAQGKTSNGTSVTLDVTMPKGATSLTATLTPSSLNSLVSAGVSSLTINGSPVTMSFDQKALAEIQRQSSGNLSITIAPDTSLSASAKSIIGTRPVYDLVISYIKDGKSSIVSGFGGGTATVSVPYTLGENEAVGGLYAVYVDAEGNATRIAGSAYDGNTQSIIFTTTHFSLYGVGYTAPSAKFTDMSSHWGKEAIDYAVGRGLLFGTSETTFAPNIAMTRGMLVTALGRLAGVDTKACDTNSFTDVKIGSTYQPYIEWAYKKGMIQGIGNGQFAPDKAITREEIAVIFANYAKATGYTLPVIRNAADYADADRIGSYYQAAVTAMQQANIMMGGTDNKFNPKASATRAEASAMLYRYIKLTIDPATAQGWAKNDAEQYLYYKDGKALIGTQIIDGVKYFFNTDGTLKTSWVKDGGNWRFYSGNKLVTGWWNSGIDAAKKTYYFDTGGNMVSGKWLQIDGKWYYFNTDGTLAKSTKIDEYEVDENGVRKSR